MHSFDRLLLFSTRKQTKWKEVNEMGRKSMKSPLICCRIECTLHLLIISIIHCLKERERNDYY